jgi:hypothetical protein
MMTVGDGVKMRPLWICMSLALGCGTDKEPQDDDNGTETGTPGDTDVLDETGDTVPDVDGDGDGYPASEDCDDTNADVYPYAEELCDEVDNNCDGRIDEAGATGSTIWYEDADGDGWGDPDTAVLTCEPPSGFISQGQDCNDDEATANPWALEICDGIDNNCNGIIDDELGQYWYADADGDGYGDPDSVVEGCDPGSGYTDNADDCDDTNSGVHPSQADRCNGVDDDCDGDIDEDVKVDWMLVTISTNDETVYEIDPATADVTDITSISDTSLKINTMDVSENGLAIVQDNEASQMLVMDACTGTTSALGATGVGNMCGIAFGPGGLLYGLDSTNDHLIEIDPLTGAGTVIGDLGFNLGNCGLSYDCSANRLIGADANTNQIFTVDPFSGAVSAMTSTSVPFSSVGLEFDQSRGIMYASTGSALYEVEPTSGATTYIGDLSASVVDDLAFHPTCP